MSTLTHLTILAIGIAFGWVFGFDHATRIFCNPTPRPMPTLMAARITRREARALHRNRADLRIALNRKPTGRAQ